MNKHRLINNFVQKTHQREKYLFEPVSDLGCAPIFIRVVEVFFKSCSISTFFVWSFSSSQLHVSVLKECSIYVSSLSRTNLSPWILTKNWPLSCKSLERSFLRPRRSFWFSGWITSYWSIAHNSLWS